LLAHRSKLTHVLPILESNLDIVFSQRCHQHVTVTTGSLCVTPGNLARLRIYCAAGYRIPALQASTNASHFGTKRLVPFATTKPEVICAPLQSTLQHKMPAIKMAQGREGERHEPNPFEIVGLQMMMMMRLIWPIS
jgi:hypothetical protein